MRRSLYMLITLLGVLLMVACSKTPSGIIPPDKMADLLADIHRGDAVVDIQSRKFRDDSTRRLLKQSILAKHGVTGQEFDTSLVWYGNNMPLYVEVYDKVVERLESDLKQARVEGPVMAAGEQRRALDGDTVDVWIGSRSARISRQGASDFITFMITSDRTWEPGDSYHLSSYFTGSHSNSRHTIVVEYNDGSAEYVFDTPTGDGFHQTDIYLDPDKTASRVYGSIHYNPAAGETVFVDSLSLVRQRYQKGDTMMRRGQTVLKTVR